MDITKYKNQIDDVLNSPWQSSTQSIKQDLELTVESYHEVLIAKFRPKLKEVWKTTQLFRHELNQILYDFTVKVMNRFKGFDLVDSA